MVTDPVDASILSNLQIRLAARPSGLPKPSDWNLARQAVTSPEPGAVLIKVLYLSLDPAMRGWMNEGKSYIPPVGIGEVMREGKFRSREDVVDGLANFPATLNLLFSGGNFGKLVLKVADA